MTDTGRFTIGVFQDVEWARKGIDALLSDGIGVLIAAPPPLKKS